MAGKRILLTGVSQGLGFGTPHDFARVDVADDSAVAAWSQHVLATFGTPDLLINNAAIINANAPLWDVSAADFRQLTDVNINGVHSVLRHFIRRSRPLLRE